MIKVALIGAHGSGKTTACLDIALGLKKEGVGVVKILDEVATELPRLPGFAINESTTELAQRYILLEQMRGEIFYEAKQNIDVLICDRGSIDNYAYFKRGGFSDSVLDSFVREHAKSYDALFKIHPDSKYLKDDGIRSTSRPFQIEIDGIVTKILKEWNIPFDCYDGDPILASKKAVKKIINLMDR